MEIKNKKNKLQLLFFSFLIFTFCLQKPNSTYKMYDKTLKFFENNIDNNKALFDFTLFNRIEQKFLIGKSIFDSIQVGYILWELSDLLKDKKLKSKSKNLAEKIFSSIWEYRQENYLWEYEARIGLPDPDIDTTSTVLAIYKITNFKNIPKKYVENLTQYIRDDGTVKIWISDNPFGREESGDVGIAANVLWLFSVYDIYNERVEKMCNFIREFVSNPQKFKDIWYRTYYLSDYLAFYNIVRALPFMKCKNKNDIGEKIEKILTDSLHYDKELNITLRCAILSSLFKLSPKSKELIGKIEIAKIPEYLNEAMAMEKTEYIYAGDVERKYILGSKFLSTAICLEALVLSNYRFTEFQPKYSISSYGNSVFTLIKFTRSF